MTGKKDWWITNTEQINNEDKYEVDKKEKIVEHIHKSEVVEKGNEFMINLEYYKE